MGCGAVRGQLLCPGATELEAPQEPSAARGRAGRNGTLLGVDRYGAPLGPMQFMAANMNRATLVDGLTQRRLPDRFQARLLRQVNDTGYTTPQKGQGKVADNAGQAKRSWPRRASVNCLLIGSAVTGITLIIRAVFERDVDLTRASEAGTAACATFVAAKKINRWTKKHGYDLDD